MADRPPRDLDWIPDNTTGINVPSQTKQNAGWLIEKPARQFFNWLWNRLSRWVHFLSGQSQEFIVIDSTNANEKDYDTLAAYIADAPAAGDKVLVKETQALTAQMIIPDGITLRLLDGITFTRATDEANSVIKFGSDIIIEGVLRLVLSHTGTTAKAVEFDGDNVIGEIEVENSSTGTLTTAYHVNADKTGNKIRGVVDNTGGGIIVDDLLNLTGGEVNFLYIYNSENRNAVFETIYDIIPHLLQFGLFTGKLKDVSAQDVTSENIRFSYNGLIMYYLGDSNNTVYQYTLLSPWDVSTASYTSKSFSVGTQEATPVSIAFSVDGSIMYAVGFVNQTVYQYTLSTPWDVSTASYASKSLSVASEDTLPRGLNFKSDGTAMFIIGDLNNTLYQYTLATPWDMATASYASKSFSVAAEDGLPRDGAFSPDGSIMYIIGDANNAVFQYILSTPWDVSTAAYASKSLDISAEEDASQGMAISPDGTKLYTIGLTNQTVYQYTMNMVVRK